MKEGYVTIKGVKIYYLVLGRGSPAIFIHGHRSDAKRFRGIFEKIGQKYKIYALDLPGFGRSDELKAHHSLENYFPYILEFVERLKFDKFTLIGASMGATLGALVAMEMPHRINKVTFLAPIFDRSSFKIPKMKYLWVTFLVSIFPKSKFVVKLINSFIRNDKLFRNFLKLFFPPEARKPEILDYEVKQWRVMDIKIWAQTLSSLLTFKFPEKRVKVQSKALFVFTEEDQYLDVPRTINSFSEIFPNFEVVTIPGLKHMPKGDLSQILKNPMIKELFDKI